LLHANFLFRLASGSRNAVQGSQDRETSLLERLGVTSRLDEKVEVVVEGARQNIDAFIAFLDKEYDFLISPKEKEVKNLKAKGDLTEFHIEP
jgi:hydrogenase maturation factor HypF (carbamoyltransferase family)